MKILLWVPVVVFALLSLRAIAFVAYQGLNGTAFEEEEIIVAGIGLVCGWIAWVMYKTLIRPGKKPRPLILSRWFRGELVGVDRRDYDASDINTRTVRVDSSGERDCANEVVDCACSRLELQRVRVAASW
ncbi:hypothetical protein [Stenotrophomonas pavanii]|uniref:hypothetical protein n=2 Tax=Lysobacteraceae TaxID=32033 RepID=UPI0039C671AA